MASKSQIRFEIFAREYITDLNATRAYVAAGYSEKGAEAAGSRLLRNIKVRKLIAELLEKRIKKLDLNADSVLTELKLMGFSNMLDYIGISNGEAYVDLSKLTREHAAAIQEITVDRYTDGVGDEARTVKRTKFKLADKRSSLELLGRYLKLFSETHEVTGPGGNEIRIVVEHIGQPKN